MSISAWSQSRDRRSILFLVAMLALAGIVGAFKLPVSLFPAVDFPRAVVSLDAGRSTGGANGNAGHTRPVEEAVRRVPGVRNDAFHNQPPGSAEISINFELGPRHGYVGPANQRRNCPDTRATPGGHPVVDQADGSDRQLPYHRLQPDDEYICRRYSCATWPNTSCAPCCRGVDGVSRHPDQRRRCRGIPVSPSTRRS